MPSSPGSPALPVSHATNLTGGWLLLGSMPTYFVPLTNTATNIAASFQVDGTTITGSANLQSVCSSGGAFSYGFVGALGGEVHDDGTFTVTSTSSIVSPTFTIQGTVPTNANGSWSGTATFTNIAGSNASCAASLMSPFTAVPFQTVSGTYMGSGQLAFVQVESGLAPALGTAYSMTATITQPYVGGTQEPLSTTIQMSGFPCFTSGTGSTVVASSIESNVLNIDYTMNDGASVSIAATVNNTAGTQLAVSGVYVRGDSCQGNYFIATNPAQINSPLLLSQ